MINHLKKMFLLLALFFYETLLIHKIFYLSEIN